MKKIKSVKLKRDYSTPEKWIFSGTELKKYDEQNFVHDRFNFNVDRILPNPDFFDITFENDFFEVKPLERGFRLVSSGDAISDDIYIASASNRFATRQEAEFENMRRETLHYFRELAKELNGGTGDWGWKYSLQSSYKCLRYREGQLSLEGLWSTIYECIKFSPSLTIEQITERALPSMVENFIKICKSQY